MVAPDAPVLLISFKTYFTIFYSELLRNLGELFLIHEFELIPTELCSYAVLLIEKKDEEGQAQVLSAALEVFI